MSIVDNIFAVVAVAVTGAVIAYAAFRRSANRIAQKRTARDLRSELRAEQGSLRAVIEALPAQIDLARRSRTTAAYAAGNTPSEGLRQWLCELDLDLSEVELLRSQVSAGDTDYKILSDMDVDIRLVEVLGLSLRASALAEKYRSAISVQETDRESFADDAEALLQASQYSLNNSRPSIRESVV